MEKKYIAFLLKSGFSLDEVMTLDEDNKPDNNADTNKKDDNTDADKKDNNTDTKQNNNNETDDNNTDNVIENLKTEIKKLRDELVDVRKISQNNNRSNAVIDTVDKNQLSLEDKVNKLLEEVN